MLFSLLQRYPAIGAAHFRNRTPAKDDDARKNQELIEEALAAVAGDALVVDAEEDATRTDREVIFGGQVHAAAAHHAQVAPTAVHDQLHIRRIERGIRLAAFGDLREQGVLLGVDGVALLEESVGLLAPTGALLERAPRHVKVMHCLPAYRGKEIDEATFEAHAQTIFDQAENRLHAQQGILLWCLGVI